MEMASPAPKRSLTMAMMLWLESWRLVSSSAVFLSWQCPISESVMSLMCSWGRAKGSEAPGQVKPPVTQLQEAPALPSLTSTKGDAGGRGCQVQHPARGSRVWWRTGCRAKPVGSAPLGNWEPAAAKSSAQEALPHPISSRIGFRLPPQKLNFIKHKALLLCPLLTISMNGTMTKRMQ